MMMECGHKKHVVLPSIDSEMGRQECFIVTMRQPTFQAVAWEVGGEFVRTDWMQAAGAELAESVGGGALAIAVLPKFILDAYIEYGIVMKTESLGEMDLDELNAYCSGVRQ